ncbi:MAG: bifunctional ADP-dependent NAD(P)H-hydrate dehydratase/NAD(P)H-hydrate epimerase [Marmoricola sp.]
MAQVRAAEAIALAKVPAGALMQRAAAGLAAAIVDFLGGVYGARILLLVGPGDNGGDALYAGAMLARRGAQVEAVLLRDNDHLPGFRSAGGRVVSEPSRIPDLVVDGITGIGGRAGLDDRIGALLADLAGIPVVAVDVPSGVEVDSGETPASHVRADLTVTFGTHKACHLVDPAALASGVVHLVELDLELPEPPLAALTPTDVASLLAWPDASDHKYTRGVVGVWTGSERYPGAAVLSVAGASSGLCGMVRYAGPAIAAVQARHPDVVAGRGRVQAWVVGSGGDDDAATAWAQVRADGVPIVVDADGLEAMAQRPAGDAVDSPGAPAIVMTPHAGELALLLELSRAEIEAAPLRHARLAADRFGATVLLKGRRSIIAAPSGAARVTTSGVPWLGVAGSGDVLAGIIGALLASGLEPFDAASVGSWLHGAAATLASAGGPITAGRLADAVPAVVRALAD